jgi:hypothetical protein
MGTALTEIGLFRRPATLIAGTAVAASMWAAGSPERASSGCSWLRRGMQSGTLHPRGRGQRRSARRRCD